MVGARHDDMDAILLWLCVVAAYAYEVWDLGRAWTIPRMPRT